MKLTSLQVQRFSVFSQATLGFSPAINVLVGRNGAGKSHLLKLMYSTLRAHMDGHGHTVADGGAAELARKLAGVYRPDEGAIGRLVTRGTGRSKARVQLTAEDGGRTLEHVFTLSSLGRVKVESTTLPPVIQPCVFLPSREALAMYEGFLQAYEGRELSFDETYRDLCVQLGGLQLRGPRLSVAQRLAAPLEQELGGQIRLIGGRFYRLGNGGNLEAHLLSEGLRKLGVLTHLVLNGSLIRNGFLFWDEPEANLNPRLVTVIARTLRHLAGMGVQVFIATHDFLLLNELALADDYKDQMDDGAPVVDVRFIGLNLSSDQSEVAVQVADSLRDLERNDVLEEFGAYYDRRASILSKSFVTTSGRRRQ